MLISPAAMRLFLILCLLGMQALAAFYLRQRQLTLAQYLGWGLLIALVPALGPFLAILLRPGRPAVRIIRRRGKSFKVQASPAELIRQFVMRIRLTKP